MTRCERGRQTPSTLQTVSCRAGCGRDQLMPPASNSRHALAARHLQISRWRGGVRDATEARHYFVARGGFAPDWITLFCCSWLHLSYLSRFASRQEIAKHHRCNSCIFDCCSLRLKQRRRKVVVVNGAHIFGKSTAACCKTRKIDNLQDFSHPLVWLHHCNESLGVCKCSAHPFSE